MGIEPTSEAWEASILPLYDARSISLSYSRPRVLTTPSFAMLKPLRFFKQPRRSSGGICARSAFASLAPLACQLLVFRICVTLYE